MTPHTARSSFTPPNPPRAFTGLVGFSLEKTMTRSPWEPPSSIAPSVSLQLDASEAAALGHLLAWFTNAVTGEAGRQGIDGEFSDTELTHLAGIRAAFAQHGDWR